MDGKCGLVRRISYGSWGLNPHRANTPQKEVPATVSLRELRPRRGPRQAVDKQDAASRTAPYDGLIAHNVRTREKLLVTGCVQVFEDVRRMRYQMAASTLLRVQRLLLLAKARSQRTSEPA